MKIAALGIFLAIAFALGLPVKERQSHTMDILDQAGRECRAMGPTACLGYVAEPAQ